MAGLKSVFNCDNHLVVWLVDLAIASVRRMLGLCRVGGKLRGLKKGWLVEKLSEDGSMFWEVQVHHLLNLCTANGQMVHSCGSHGE